MFTPFSSWPGSLSRDVWRLDFKTYLILTSYIINYLAANATLFFFHTQQYAGDVHKYAANYN